MKTKLRPARSGVGISVAGLDLRLRTFLRLAVLTKKLALDGQNGGEGGLAIRMQ